MINYEPGILNAHKYFYTCVHFLWKGKQMNHEELKRRILYESILLLGVLLLFSFLCRLWPIILVILITIFILFFWYVILSYKKDRVNTQPVVLKKTNIVIDKEAFRYDRIQKQITSFICSEYPQAKWIWENPQAKNDIQNDNPVYILLNKAGGYRRAKIIIENYQVIRIDFSNGKSIVSEEQLLALRWIENNVIELNKRCNESIQYGQSATLLLNLSELPPKTCWTYLCDELKKYGLKQIHCLETGIEIILTQ